LSPLLALALAYLLGSIPFGFLLARLRGVDLRSFGSGNIGATNAMRAVGRPLGLCAFALDFGKGAAAVLLLGGESPGLRVGTAAAAVVGHVWPIYLRFRGGKAVATSLGALCLLDLPAALAGCILWIGTLYLTRYVSLASVAMGAGFFAAVLLQVLSGEPRPELLAATAALLVLILVRHRSNMARIRAGVEPKSRLFAPKSERQAP
jgi:glycerol-3-phosphate acyltransferase PlsY